MFTDLRATEVLAAGQRLRELGQGLIRRTPLVRSDALAGERTGPVYLKMENEQVTGSFKVRGAMNALATLPPEVRERGVVASSAGNHGLGIAFAAKHLGVRATIFVPATAPRVKREGIAALGATVNAEEPHYDAAMARAMAFAAEHGRAFVNPCAGEMLLAGQGTVALEILEALPTLRTLIVPVGGAGLLGGCASLVRRVAPEVRIVGAQSVNTAAMARSLAAGRLVEVEYLPTLADGLAGQIDEEGLDIGRHALDEMVLVEETDVERAIAWLADAHGARVEGSGAVGVAALLTARVRSVAAGGAAAIIVSGGNIDAERFDAVRARVVAGAVGD